jgi:hypothetical protein
LLVYQAAQVEAAVQVLALRQQVTALLVKDILEELETLVQYLEAAVVAEQDQ